MITTHHAKGQRPPQRLGSHATHGGQRQGRPVGRLRAGSDFPVCCEGEAAAVEVWVAAAAVASARLSHTCGLPAVFGLGLPPVNQ